MGTLTEQTRVLATDIANSRNERAAWLAALKDDMGALRTEMRSQSRARRAWVKSLRGEVTKMGQDLRRDLAGARRAWEEATEGKPHTASEGGAARGARRAARHRK